MADSLTGNPPRTQGALDQIVADAKSAPALVSKLETVAPDIVQTIEAPAMTAAHGAYGTFAVALVGMAVAHFGLGWSSDFQALAAGAIVLGAGALVHLASKVAFPSTFFKGIKL